MKLVALVLLLSAFSSLTLTEVVKDFKQTCPFFFQKLNNINDIIIIVPTIFTGPQYKQICQYWEKDYRFATLYDTERRIPVYSAYTFLQEAKTTYNNKWKIEPQLENIEEYKGKPEMIVSPYDEETVRKITHQAVDLDYNGSLYDRGHVFPRFFAADQNQADSTFTLTNIAPQTGNSNRQWESQVEERMRKCIKHSCILKENQKAYIVTGVVPGKNWLNSKRQQKNKKIINIPSHYWSAFCCTNKKGKLIGKAYIAEQENFNVQHPTIDELNTQLSDLYKYNNFSVFPGLLIENIKPPF